MKRIAKILAVSLLSITTFAAFAQSEADKSRLRSEIEKDLTENILPF